LAIEIGVADSIAVGVIAVGFGLAHGEGSTDGLAQCVVGPAGGANSLYKFCHLDLICLYSFADLIVQSNVVSANSPNVSILLHNLSIH